MRRVLLGLAIGIAASLALMRFVAELLFEVSPADPLTGVIVVVVTLLATVPACAIPAGRSARIDPIRVLRYE